MSTIKVDTIQTAGGTEVYTAKAWVNFNGSGTVAIRDSGNASSITDTGIGQYTVNIASALSSSNYSMTSNSTYASDGTKGTVATRYGYNTAVQTYTTTALALITGPSNQLSLADFQTICVAMHL